MPIYDYFSPEYAGVAQECEKVGTNGGRE